jgi:hypothetical protein
LSRWPVKVGKRVQIPETSPPFKVSNKQIVTMSRLTTMHNSQSANKFDLGGAERETHLTSRELANKN